MPMPTATLPLDHLVMPVLDLATARRRFESLGFTVAPDGVHPFGTANCCIYFPGGVFMEPLAVVDPALATAAAAAGNVFVSHDRLFRSAMGEEGLSAVVMSTDDARADHARFVASGLSAGDVLDFSRPFTDHSGRTGTASFRLAFARSPDIRELLVFACERIGVPNVDRAALERHGNGVTGIVSVVFSADEPAAFASLLSLAGAQPESVEGGFAYQLPNGRIEVMSPTAAADRYGIAANGKGIEPGSVVFAVGDLEATARRFRDGGVSFQESPTVLRVTPGPGQGVDFVFVEAGQ